EARSATSAGKHSGFGASSWEFRPHGRDWLALAFGLFLGLALLKFGNPVVLDSKVSAPKNLAEFWFYAWPPSWSLWFLLPLAIIAGFWVVGNKPRWPGSKSLWLLP